MIRSRRIFAGVLIFGLLGPLAIAGGGGSGGGGGSTTTNPLLGTWQGVPGLPGSAIYYPIVYDFTFNKDLTFNLVVLDRNTGESEFYTGTYNLNAPSPGPYPYLTLISGGQIILQKEYLRYEGAMILRWGIGPPVLTLAKL